VKADQMVDDIPALQRVCRQKVEKPEIPEIQVTKGLSEDTKPKGKNN